MLTEKRFQKIESEYFGDCEKYDSSNPNYDRIKLLLISIYEVEEIHEKYKPLHTDARHWPQQQFITRSIDDILSTFSLMKNHFYSSAYRDVRSLFETYLLLNYMNDHKIETATVYKKQERNLQNREDGWHNEDGLSEMSWEELYIEDKFHEMRREEKNRLEDKYDDFKQLYNYFSNRHIHPARLDGVNIQREYSAEEERQLTDWQLDFTLGLVYQMIKLYLDTDNLRNLADDIIPIGEVLEENHTPQSFIDLAEDNFPVGTENIE